MFVYMDMNEAGRSGRNAAIWFVAVLCLLTVWAFAPHNAKAATPAGASVSPEGARSSAPAASGAPQGVSSRKPVAGPKAAAKPKAQAGKKKARPVVKKKDSAGAAVAKPEALPQKDGALKTFPVSSVPAVTPKEAAKLQMADTWQPLAARLSKDGLDHAYLRAMFGRLGDSYSHVPMGTKINELFSIKYMPKPARTTATPGKSDAPPVYRWAVKSENVVKCKEYIERHKDAFAGMEKEYGIPKEIVAGLLMVETRLGTYLGASSSFWSLACLAAADTPDRVAPTLQALPLPMTPDKMEWVSKLVRERSAWAYKELLALVKHCRENDLDPLVMPGSVYGAVGICQFMPSNLPKFAVDGNKDGKIDLFDPADAIPSVGNYLKKHGWRNEDRDARHQVIKKYNKSNVYANTILALAEAITAPPAETLALADDGKKASSGTKPAATKNSAGKASRKKPAGTKTPSVKNAAKSVSSSKKAAAGSSSAER